MLFSSYDFLFIFLPLTILFVFLVQKLGDFVKLPVYVLLAASLIFYGWADLNLLVLIIGSITVNYVLSEVLHRRHSKFTLDTVS